MKWAGRGYVLPTLGRAAAAAFEGRGASYYELLGTETLPIPWPRIDAAEPIRALAPHLSLGGFVGLVRAGARLAEEEEKRLELTQELVRAYLGTAYDPADTEMEAELREEIGFQLEEAVEETRETRAMREWLQRSEELVRTRGELLSLREELRPKLQDKLVFVGWNATGSGDFYPTALHERTPGVVIHAAVASAALTGYAVRDAHVFWNGLVALLLGCLAARLCARARGPLAAFLRCLLLGLAYAAVNALYVFGDRGLLLALFGPSASVALGWAGTAVTAAVRERRERARLERQFGARISKQLFDHLLANPDVVQLAGREREVTCFFADLAGFTALSESLDSESTVVVLNRFMRAMNEELTRHGAYVNKFLGDGLMAVWGAFEPDEEQATRACRAALDCRARLKRLNADLTKERLPRLSMRIGIATGRAVVGDCGAPPELSDYTVIGDPVNLAARLEAAGKQLGAAILIDGGTGRHVTDAFLARPLGRFTVVGQRTPADLFELLAPAGFETEPQRELFSRTARAVALYQERELEAALDAWREIEAEHGSSGLVGFYAAAIEHARTHPDEPFDGVLHLAHK
jgi:adenylate cyclase